MGLVLYLGSPVMLDAHQQPQKLGFEPSLCFPKLTASLCSASEKRPSQKESHLPTTKIQGAIFCFPGRIYIITQRTVLKCHDSFVDNVQIRDIPVIFYFFNTDIRYQHVESSHSQSLEKNHKVCCNAWEITPCRFICWLIQCMTSSFQMEIRTLSAICIILILDLA